MKPSIGQKLYIGIYLRYIGTRYKIPSYRDSVAIAGIHLADELFF